MRPALASCLPYSPTVAWVGLGLMAFAAIVAPKALPVLLIVMALYTAYETLRTGALARPTLLEHAPAALAVGAFALYAEVSSAWSVTHLGGLTSATTLAAWAAIALVFMWRAAAERDALDPRVLTGFVVAVALGALYVGIEEASHGAIKRWLYDHVPLIHPRDGTTGDDLIIPPFDLDRNLAVLNLLVWPALLVLERWRGRHWRLASGLLAALVAAATLPSVHASSKVALVVALVVFGLAELNLKWARYVLMAAWVAATLLVVPAIEIGYDRLGLNHAAWLPSSARDRMELWSYTADRVGKHVVLGAGAGSVRALDDTMRQHGNERLPVHLYERRFAPHSHNVYLQTWFELGAVGALLLMAAGMVTIWRLRTLPPDAEPYALAAFAASGGLAAFSYGLWQAWFLALFAFVAALLALAALGPTGGPRMGPEPISRRQHAGRSAR